MVFMRFIEGDPNLTPKDQAMTIKSAGSIDHAQALQDAHLHGKRIYSESGRRPIRIVAPEITIAHESFQATPNIETPIDDILRRA